MADDRNIRGAADRSRINMQEDYEVRYWTENARTVGGGYPRRRRHGEECSSETRQGALAELGRAHANRPKSVLPGLVWPPYDWAMPTLGPFHPYRNGFRSPDILCPRAAQQYCSEVSRAGVGSVSAYRATARMAGQRHVGWPVWPDSDTSTVKAMSFRGPAVALHSRLGGS
jgi:hypothetical protein